MSSRLNSKPSFKKEVVFPGRTKRDIESVKAKMKMESKLSPKSYEETRRSSTMSSRMTAHLKTVDAKISIISSTSRSSTSTSNNFNGEWKTMVCRKCDPCVVYPNMELYESHVELCHRPDRPHRCSHCEKSFPTLSLRKIHEQIHNPKTIHYQFNVETQSFVCVICDRNFKTERSMLQHRFADHLYPLETVKIVDPPPEVTENKMKNLWKVHLESKTTTSSQSSPDPEVKSDVLNVK